VTKDLEQLQPKAEWLLDGLLDEVTLTEALAKVPIVKLIAFDLDGTLLTTDKRITERSKTIIQKLESLGIVMMPCTGRPSRNTKEILEQLGLTKAVVLHGAGFYNFKRDKTVYRYRFATTEALEILERMYQIDGVIAGMESPQGWFLDPNYFAWRQTQPQIPSLEPTGVGDLKTFLDSGSVKLYFRHPDLNARELSITLGNVSAYRTWSSERLLEVLPEMVNKREALMQICTTLRISWQEVITFGDEHNDQGMLLWAGLGVAMKNAKPEAKEVSDYITKSNDDDGVAEVLEELYARVIKEKND
jgi:Cof subfamily protein (haloacid dehalogenase superfamily)